MLRWSSLLVALLLYQTVCGELDTERFSQQVDRLTNDILGAAKFQDYLENEVTFQSKSRSPQQVLDKVSSDLYRKVSDRVAAVTNIQQAVRSSYSSFSNTAVYDNCCGCCPQNSDRSAQLRFHTKDIDMTKMCYGGQGTKSYSGREFPTSAVNNVMKQNLADNPSLKWQYYGGEDGILSVYPGNKLCSPKYDPRYRPWYSHTAFPTPKDIVIIIDRSGSMNYFHDDRELLAIAKDAAETVIDTMSPDDRAAVVFFSNSAETIRSGCQESKLALMTPENKATLKYYVQSKKANGSTFYGKALDRAFSYFNSSSSKPENDDRERVKVILFLTDGAPTDSDYLDVISRKNRILGNKVVILTFGFGLSIDSEVKARLEDIAKQTKNDASAGITTPGRFVYVSDPDTLRHQMAAYYDFFSSNSNTDEVTVSIPYLDAFGLGLITSICLPVRVSGTFRGVTCIDITLSDLFSDATFFSRGVESYAMVMDAQTRLLVHPLVPRPSDVYADPLILRVRDLEDNPRMEPIVRNYFLKGIPGNETFTSRRVVSRGDSEHEGVNKRQITSTYMWKPLGLARLIVCVVLGEGDQQKEVSSPNRVTSFPYHRLDITEPAGQCRYINRVAVTDTSTVKFAPFAFTSPDLYLESDETISLIQMYKDHFMGTNEAPFQSGVFNALAISEEFDAVLDKTDTAWQSSVWRYLGLRDGVFRLFPGAKLVPKYDHTVRTWYKRAISQPKTITLSQPYVDAFGAGIVITLSKAMSQIKTVANDVTLGVMGMDFTIDLFNSYLTSYMTGCETDKCFVIDNAGYMIAHKDFEGLREKDVAKVENIHISQKEPHIAKILYDNGAMKKDGCINYAKKQVQTFWRVSDSTIRNLPRIEMSAVRGTNVYVVRSSGGSGYQCSCSVSQGATIPACTSSSCECPCYNRKDVQYDECTSSFNFGELVYPPCAPPSPSVNLASVAKEEEKVVADLEYCYPVEEVCPGIKQKLKCSSTAGCMWSGKKCGVRKITVQDDGVSITAIVLPCVLIILIIIVIVVICKTLKKRKEKKLKKRNQRIRDTRIKQNAIRNGPNAIRSEHNDVRNEPNDVRNPSMYNSSRVQTSNPDIFLIQRQSNPAVTSGHDNPVMSTEPVSVSTDPMNSQPTAPQDEQQPPPTYAEVHNYPVLSP